MKKIFVPVFSLLLLVCVSVNQSLACTTFCLKNKNEILFGKNYDWMIGDGMVLVNKHGVSKVSNAEGGENPAKWVSKYGSVTFNQYGRENPMGGMNEAGLVIELMWLDGTQYPKADNRPTVDVLEWIQYQLDTASTVEEVLKNTEAMRITSRVTLHYLVNDKAGNSTTIEFLDGKLVAHRGDKLEVPALANDTYERSLKYAKNTAPEKAQSESSLDRFTRAAQKTKEFDKQQRTEQEAVNYAFDILANVAQKNGTQWSIVYDQKRGKVHFRTRQSQAIKTVDTKAFDYTCGSAVKMFDVNAKESGDVTAKFTDYTRAANRDLIERSFNGTDFLRNVPAGHKELIATYPETFACANGNQKAEAEQLKQPANNSTLLGKILQPIYYLFETIALLIG